MVTVTAEAPPEAPPRLFSSRRLKALWETIAGTKQIHNAIFPGMPHNPVTEEWTLLADGSYEVVLRPFTNLPKAIRRWKADGAPLNPPPRALFSSQPLPPNPSPEPPPTTTTHLRLASPPSEQCSEPSLQAAILGPNPLFVPPTPAPVTSAFATNPDMPSIVTRVNEFPVASSDPPCQAAILGPNPLFVPPTPAPVTSAFATNPDMPSIVTRVNEFPVASSDPPCHTSPADPNRPNCHQPSSALEPPASPPSHLPPELLPFDTPPRRQPPSHHHEPPSLPFSAAPPDPPLAVPPDPPDQPPCRPPHQPDDCIQHRPFCTQGTTHTICNSNNTLCRVNPGPRATGSRIVKSVVDVSSGSMCTSTGNCWCDCSSFLALHATLFQAHTHIAPHA